MQRKIVAASIAAAVTAVFTTAGSGALAQQAPKLSGNSVRIAVMSDMSGLYSDLGGQGSVVAAQMAIDDFIAANKPAYKIDVVSADHQNKADVAANRAREWFDTQNVDMITDLLNSAVAIAVGKVANEKKRLSMARPLRA
jgi:branched-chain amino acid transport system substrate-binding protein